jgi:hypothetical protein
MSQQQRWLSITLASALCFMVAGCAKNPADQLLAFELEQAKIIVDYRHDCEAMAYRMRLFLQKNNDAMRALYPEMLRRGNTFDAHDARYTPEVNALLKRAHVTRKGCQGQAASPTGPLYTPQLVELL